MSTNSLVHGLLFPALGIKIPRLLTAHHEAFGASRVETSGVKFDKLAATTSGQPIFTRDEETAVEIRATFVIDLSQLRSFGHDGKGLSDSQKTFLLRLALWKIGKLVGSPFRYRSGCDLELVKLTLERMAGRGLFDQLGLRSYPKTSGSKGIHLHVPLNTEVTYEQTKPFTRAVAETLEAKFGDRVVSSMAKKKRAGKVLIDWSQNDRHKTTVCVYSLRAKARPTVSTPLEWEELEAALAAGDPDRLVFDADAVLRRVNEKGDLFAPLLSERQRLPDSA